MEVQLFHTALKERSLDMSLRVTSPPEEGLQMIRSAVGSLMSQPTTRTAVVTENEATDDISVAAPHPVYFVGTDEIAAGRLLEAAALVGWRYILLVGERSMLAAEVAYDRESGQLEFSHTNDGPLVAGTLEGVRVAEELKEVRDADFELRLLEVPGLSIAALWLHAEGQDLLMPIPPVRRGMKPYRVYTEEELLRLVGGAAVKRLQIRDDRA
jgi:hypothetical protein